MATPLARLEGKYEILEKIQEGGMGAVYRVRHRLLDEVRVVKVMRPHLAGDEVLQARFLREAKVAIKLHHPNLAQICDFTADDSGYTYLVMEFIDGLNLQEVIKIIERPGFGLVLEVARQSLEALGYLHRKHIIHRDVSPDNLLVTRDDFARASDFLDEARALQADHPQVADLVSDAETEVKRRIDAYRCQMAIENVIQSVSRQLDNESVEEACRELGVAHRLYGESDVLGELSARIDSREREMRIEGIAKLVKSSQKKKRAPEDAIADLEAPLSDRSPQ